MTPTPCAARMLSTTRTILTHYSNERKGSIRRKVLDGLRAVRSTTTVMQDAPLVFTLRRIDLLSTLPQLSLRKRARLRQMRPKVVQQLLDHLDPAYLQDMHETLTGLYAPSSLLKMAAKSPNRSVDTLFLTATSKSTQYTP